MLRILIRGVIVSIALSLIFAGLSAGGAARSPKEFTVVNIESPQGVKVWLPTSLVVRKGDKAIVKLINKLDTEHGYRIVGYNIERVVQGDQSSTIEFTADKAGIFGIDCQLHPAHVGGQLVVLP